MNDGNGPGQSGHEPLGSVGEEAAKLFSALQDWARDSASEAHHPHDHPDTGTSCTWCPVCRAAQLVRQASPEVKAHLASAASSLLQAAAGVIAAAQPPAGAAPGAASCATRRTEVANETASATAIDRRRAMFLLPVLEPVRFYPAPAAGVRPLLPACPDPSYSSRSPSVSITDRFCSSFVFSDSSFSSSNSLLRS